MRALANREELDGGGELELPTNHAARAVELLDEIEAFRRRLVTNLESGENLGLAPLVDLLEMIERARAHCQAATFPGRPSSTMATGGGLVIVDGRIRTLFAAWPDQPRDADGHRLLEDLNALILFRRDLEAQV